MSILDRLTTGRRADALRAPRLAKHASEHTDIDQWMLDDLKQSAPKFAQALATPITYTTAEGEQAYEPSADIHDDIFLGAHTPGESKVKAPEDMRPSHRFGRDVLDAFFSTDAHRDAKTVTEANSTASAIYTRAAMQKFDELMGDKAMRQQVEQSQQQHEREQELERVRDELEKARKEGKREHDRNGQVPGPLVDRIKQLTKEREKLIDEQPWTPPGSLPVDRPGMPGGLPGPIVQAIEQATEEAKDRAQVWGNLQGFANGALDRATPDEAWDMAEAWMQLTDFRELVKLIGRVVRDFRTQDAKNVIGGNDEVVGIEYGNNLSRTLPTELARLGSPLTQRSFLRDYMDEELMQFQTQGSEKIALGPGVLCMDNSGSMGGRKLLEAKAVIVGYVRLMHKKKRDAVVIVFNGRIVWEHHFPHRAPIDMAALLGLAAIQADGGTNITNSVVRAEEYIKRAQPFRKADVLVVTDGEDNSYNAATDRVKANFAQAGVRTMGIAIGGQPTDKWLLKFCDHAIGVASITDATADIVRAVS